MHATPVGSDSIGKDLKNYKSVGVEYVFFVASNVVIYYYLFNKNHLCPVVILKFKNKFEQIVAIHISIFKLYIRQQLKYKIYTSTVYCLFYNIYIKKKKKH